jgi:hypothetical protein
MVVEVLSYGSSDSRERLTTHIYLMQRLKTIITDYHNPQDSHLVEMGRRGKCICKNVKMCESEERKNDKDIWQKSEGSKATIVTFLYNIIL